MDFLEKKDFFFKIEESGKYTVECDWKSKNSENVQTLGCFLGKIEGCLEEKTSILFKIDKGDKLAVECVSNGFFPKNVFSASIIWFFPPKIQYFCKFKNLENMSKKVSLLRKNRFHLLKSLLYKKEDGAK